MPAQDLAQQVREIGMHEIDQLPADELSRRCRAAEFCKPGVGQRNAIAVDCNALVHGFGQATVYGLAFGASGAFFLQLCEQAIGVPGEVFRAASGRVRRQPLGQIARLGNRREPLAKLAQVSRFTLPPIQQHGKQHRERRQDGQRGDQQVIFGTDHVLRTRRSTRSIFP